MTELSEKLNHIATLLRLLDVEIERHLHPHLHSARFDPSTGLLGPHLYVLPYTTDVKAALSLPSCNVHLDTALEIVIDWLERNMI